MNKPRRNAPSDSEIATGTTPEQDLLRHLDAELARIAPVAIWLSTPNGGFIHGNPESSRLYHQIHGREPRSGESLEQLIPPSRAEIWRNLFRQAASGYAVEADVDVPVAAGGLRIFRAHLRPVFGEDGRIVRVICSAEDLTDRKFMEQRLLLYRAALEAVDEGVVVTEMFKSHPSGLKIVYANRALRRMTGYTVKDLVGRCPLETIGKSLPPGATATLRSAIAGFEPCTVEYVQNRKDGTSFPVELRLKPIRGEFGGVRHFLTLRIDLTERRKAEEVRKKETRAEIISNMASALAHRYNNLFTLMAGAAEILSQSGTLTPQDRLQLASLTASLEQASDTTRSLLWLGRSPVSVAKRTDLTQLLAEYCRRWRASPHSRQRFRLDLATNVPEALIDPAEVFQILEIIGAYFSGREGRGETLCVELRPADDAVMVSFTDDGGSITNDEQRHLFEPFMGRPEDGLIELHLAAAREAIQKSGGGLKLLGGTGAPRIVLHLPLDPSAGPMSESHEKPAKDDALAPVILVVEDEEKIRTLLTTVLERRFRVFTASDGNAALKLIDSLPTTPAILLTDVVMPGISGRELADRLTEHSFDLRVVFMSGYSGDTLVQQRVSEAGMAFLAKPFTPRQLLSKIEEVLAMPPRRATG